MPERLLAVHHVTPHFYPEIGGLEDSVRRFGAWLVHRGYRVIVHTSSVDVSGRVLPESDRVDGIEIRRYRPIARKGYYRTWFRPDLSNAHLIHFHGYAVRTNDRVLRRGLDVPTVFSLHHGVRMPHTRLTSLLLRRAYDSLVGFPSLHRASRVIVASASDQTWLLARGFPPNRVRIMPTPLPDDAYEPGDPTWARATVGAGRFVLYLGRLHAEKGVDDLLETLPLLPDEARLVFAGPDGGRLHALRERAKALGVSDRVLFVGIVTEEQKRSLLAASTVLALPSLFEAQGLTALEAWAQRRPVVATRVGALLELMSEGEAGRLVPYHDVRALTYALSECWERPDDAARMGRRGRELAEAFRLGRIGPQLEEIYQELIRPEPTG